MSDQPPDTPTGNGPTLTQLRRLMKAREADEKAKAVAEKAASKRKDAEEEVAEAIVAAGIKGEHTRDLGAPWGIQGFQPGETEYGYVYALEEFEEWAKANGFETDFLGEPKPRKKAINQYLKRIKATGGQMPAGVERRTTRRVTVRNKK